jgi:hypothetical protein
MQLHKVLYEWFTAVCSEVKSMTGPVVVEKAKCFYDEIKMTGAYYLMAGCD